MPNRPIVSSTYDVEDQQFEIVGGVNTSVDAPTPAPVRTSIGPTYQVLRVGADCAMEQSVGNAQLRVLTWNVDRTEPKHFPLIRRFRWERSTQYLFWLDPDVMAVTDSSIRFPDRGGHTLWTGPYKGRELDRVGPDERRVVIWSKQPWTNVDQVGLKGLDQANFISAKTETPIGPIRFVGAYFPWFKSEWIDWDGLMAQSYIKTLGQLREMIDGYPEPTIVAGDFSYYVRPSLGYPVVSERWLRDCFANFSIITEGSFEGITEGRSERVTGSIDHIAINSSLTATSVWGWPHNVNGYRLSHNNGAGAVLKLSGAND